MKRLITLTSLLILGACGQTGISPREFFTGSLGGLPTQQVSTEPASLAAVTPDVTEPCRDRIAAAAESYGAVEVEVVSAGAPTLLADGTTETPLETRVRYERAGEIQVRQARITCQQDREGRVLALLDAGDG